MAVATAAEVVAGRAHTCARLTDGTVQCWGENSQGQLGVGIAGPGGMTPRPVSMLADAMGLATGAAGSHVCTTTSTGASCWGANATGQLGDLTVDDALAPVSMADITSPPATISTGGSGSGGAGYTCLLESTGAVRCIGDGGLGQLGQGAFQSSFELVEARLRQ
jgi:alpha-tubulin suppressor-like RCC1 family protein